MNNKKSFVQSFMKTTDKLKKVLGPADRDYVDPVPTQKDIDIEQQEQDYADKHWVKHNDSDGHSYVMEK